MSEKGAQLIDRLLDIVELLTLEKDGLGVTDIANRTSLHKSTVHRIVSALAERGYIEKVPERSVYKVGLKFVEISSVYLNSVELKTEATPYLRELTSKLGQPTHLAILDGTDAVYIEKVDVLNNIRLYSQIGRRIPVYCSALGKCLLSGLHEGEIDEIVQKSSFIKFTAKTLTREELLRQVRAVTTDGYAVDDEEHDEGIRCIAVPVRDYRGKVIASVSVAGPASVFLQKNDNETAKMVKETALVISKRMGYK
jgi:IclR family transcriptional regulator, KDG regulon repressor